MTTLVPVLQVMHLSKTRNEEHRWAWYRWSLVAPNESTIVY